MEVSPFKLFVILLMLPLHLVTAAPNKSKLSDESARIAMVDVKKTKATSAKIKKTQKKSVRKQNKVSKRRGQSSSSTNCLTMSAHQLHRKAKHFEKAINYSSREHRVDKNLIKAVIAVESCFRVKVKSHAGAQGLMQLIPATARRFGVKERTNPAQNINGGVKYLKFLKARFKGDLKKVLAAYNAGEGAVDKYNGIPPYKETIKYVKKVLKVYDNIRPKRKKVSKVYRIPRIGDKPGRHGWQYNRSLAPHLYKQ